MKPERRLPSLQRLAQMKTALLEAQNHNRDLRRQLQTAQQALESALEELGSQILKNMELTQEAEWNEREREALKNALHDAQHASNAWSEYSRAVQLYRTPTLEGDQTHDHDDEALHESGTPGEHRGGTVFDSPLA